ncbi:hypothetical protein DNTS_035660, partial [Danionella cerebrum]
MAGLEQISAEAGRDETREVSELFLQNRWSAAASAFDSWRNEEKLCVWTDWSAVKRSILLSLCWSGLSSLHMDFYNCRLPLLILAALGCCSEAGLLVSSKINGVVGKNVTFQTTITSTSTILTLAWNFNKPDGVISILTCVPSANTIDIDEAYINRIVYNNKTFDLQLGPLLKEDAGEYTLNVVTTSGKSVSGQIFLDVFEPVSDVKISSNVPEAVELNSTVILSCSAKGSKSYKWMNGSVPVVTDGTRMKLNAAGNELSIAEVRRTDLAGPIFCIAENMLESGRNGPENVIMRQTPADFFLKKGSSITFFCSADSDPPAQLRWIFNGATLSQITASSPTNLTIANLEEKFGGNYSCEAFNPKTKRTIGSAVAMLSVLEPLTGTNISSSSSFLIAGSSSVNLSCSAATGKADSVQWQKDGNTLLPGDRIVVSADMKSLTIQQVVKEDRGEYKCLLSNRVNKDEASYKMNINYGPESVQVAGKKTVKFEDKVELSCSADSVPPSSFSWKLNGTSLNTSQQIYVINQAKIMDSGTYTCEAYNADGKEDTGLSGGAIAGIVIAVLVAVIIIACIVKRKKKSNTEKHNTVSFTFLILHLTLDGLRGHFEMALFWFVLHIVCQYERFFFFRFLLFPSLFVLWSSGQISMIPKLGSI